jgi:hypothetical protein
LQAASFDVVFKYVVGIEDIKLNIAACPWVNDLSEISVLSVFNAADLDFRSVAAVESALAGSVDIKEVFVIEFFIIVFKLNLNNKRSAVTGHTLSSTESRFFLSLEQTGTLLFTILTQRIDFKLTTSFTARHSFHQVENLLDEDAISFESLPTLLLNGRLLHLLRRVLSRVLLRRILGRVLLRRHLLRRILSRVLLRGHLLRILLRRHLLNRVLLRRHLLNRVLLNRVLLGRILLRRILLHCY